jgi:hypothetical protein
MVLLRSFFEIPFGKGKISSNLARDVLIFEEKQPFYLLSLIMAYFPLIECQISSCFASNGPMLAAT